MIIRGARYFNFEQLGDDTLQRTLAAAIKAADSMRKRKIDLINSSKQPILTLRYDAVAGAVARLGPIDLVAASQGGPPIEDLFDVVGADASWGTGCLQVSGEGYASEASGLPSRYSVTDFVMAQIAGSMGASDDDFLFVATQHGSGWGGGGVSTQSSVPKASTAIWVTGIFLQDEVYTMTPNLAVQLSRDDSETTRFATLVYTSGGTDYRRRLAIPSTHALDDPGAYLPRLVRFYVRNSTLQATEIL